MVVTINNSFKTQAISCCCDLFSYTLKELLISSIRLTSQMSEPTSDKSITRDRLVMIVELFTCFVYQPLCLCVLTTKGRCDKSAEWKKIISNCIKKTTVFACEFVLRFVYCFSFILLTLIFVKFRSFGTPSWLYGRTEQMNLFAGFDFLKINAYIESSFNGQRITCNGIEYHCSGFDLKP